QHQLEIDVVAGLQAIRRRFDAPIYQPRLGAGDESGRGQKSRQEETVAPATLRLPPPVFVQRLHDRGKIPQVVSVEGRAIAGHSKIDRRVDGVSRLNRLPLM